MSHITTLVGELLDIGNKGLGEQEQEQEKQES